MATIPADPELSPPAPEKEAGQVMFVVGLQDGDEGKGKVVDYLAAQVAVVARGNGGSNAGHTIISENGEKVALHQVPSGISHPGKMNVIGNGVLVDPVRLKEEITEIRKNRIEVSPDNLAISGLAHFVLPIHKEKDAARESGKGAQGSTKAGIAYAQSDKVLREGVRLDSLTTTSEAELSNIAYKSLRSAKTRRNLLRIKRPPKRREARKLANEFAAAAMEFKPYVDDTAKLLNDTLKNGENVLVEGAQAFGLDLTHGKYPYVTSTGCTVAGLIEGTSINPGYIGKRVGVLKLIPSKVGGGAFVTKIDDEKIASQIRGKKTDVDGEFGATTGREREVGYLDLVKVKRAIEINGIQELVVTKFDHVVRAGTTTKICVAYERPVLTPEGGTIWEEIDVPPSNDAEIARCRPVYKKTYKTWHNNESKEAHKYLSDIEKFLGIPITMVSKGPNKDDVIMRDPFESKENLKKDEDISKNQSLERNLA